MCETEHCLVVTEDCMVVTEEVHVTGEKEADEQMRPTRREWSTRALSHRVHAWSHGVSAWSTPSSAAGQGAGSSRATRGFYAALLVVGSLWMPCEARRSGDERHHRAGETGKPCRGKCAALQ